MRATTAGVTHKLSALEVDVALESITMDFSYLTKPETAKLLRCSVRTLDIARTKHGLPFLIMPGCRRILFDREQVLTWLEQHNGDSEKEDDNNGEN